MKPMLRPAKEPNEVQIDIIANALPEEVRGDFYREMRYCRSLSENDEMLHILNILRILAVVMVDVPSRVAAERDKLQAIVGDALTQMQKNLAAIKAHQQQIDNRLAQIPAEIAKGISPSTIAASINESLRLQFVKSTIPETAKALSAAAADMHQVTADFGTAASSLGDTYEGAVTAAKKATNEMSSAVSAAAESAKQATKVLSVTYDHAYRWAFYALSALGVFVGAVLMACILIEFFWPKDQPAVEPKAAMSEPAKENKRPELPPRRKQGTTHANDPRDVGR
jgi:hypothetical protein